MRYVILTILGLASIGLAARPTTRPTLEQLRPHYSGPVMISRARVEDAKIDPATSHYLYATPAPYWYGGHGWGWVWSAWPYGY